MTIHSLSAAYGWVVRYGQHVTHRQYGGTFVIEMHDSGRVKIRGDRPNAQQLTMAVEQLFQHYAPLD